MKHVSHLLCCAAAIGAWSAPALAQRQSAVGPGVIPLSVAGGLGGVDMSSSGTTGTLSVGVLGGPQTDIYTLNNPVVGGLVAVSTGASSQGNIVFNSSSTVYGAIGVTQPGGPFLLNIDAGNTGATVNFLGPVYATTLNVVGTGAVNFNSGGINITATNFAADGSIGVAANTTLIGALTTTAGANTGTLSLGNASILNGAVGGAIGLKSIALTGTSATITGAVDAYSFSLGSNTLNIGGALTIANIGPAGVINTTIASPILYGNIRPVGTTLLGPTLHINVTVPSGTLIAVGDQFNIIQTAAGTVQSGTNGSVLGITVVDPTNPLYTFAAVPLAGTIAGQVAIRSTGTPLTAPLAPPGGGTLPPTLPIVVPIVTVLANLPPAALVDLVIPINAITTFGGVVDAATQLAPSPSSLAAPLVGFQATKTFQDLATGRMDDVLCGPTGRSETADDKTSPCQISPPRGSWWMKATGLRENQGAQDSFVGYSANIASAMVGFDMLVDPQTVVGIGIGAARSDIDGKGGDNHTDINGLHATAYAGHQSGPWFVYGDLSVGLNDYSGARQIAFPGINRRAHADYSGQDYTAYLAGGLHLPVGDFTVTPLASLQYTRANLGSYTETGAGSANLTVQGQSYDFLESALGLKVARGFIMGDLHIVPELHVKWLHELSNPTTRQNASFAAVTGSVFSTPGLKAARDTGNIGAGLSLLSCACGGNSWSLEAVYDYYRRSDRFSAHQLMIKFTSRF